MQEILNEITEKKPFITIILLDCCRNYYLEQTGLQDVGSKLTMKEYSTGLRV